MVSGSAAEGGSCPSGYAGIGPEVPQVVSAAYVYRTADMPTVVDGTVMMARPGFEGAE